MKTIMELKNIDKTYGNITALKQVNLGILEGEVLSILGPNGSGKTTLLRIMACIEKPTSGEMRFNGVKVDQGNINKVRLKTTMVFQKTALFNTSVYKNIAYGLHLREYSKKETDKKVKEALKTVQLEGYEKRPAKKLSGGEQQRVALARALTLDTDVLLLDEPTANIDPKNVSIIEEALTWLGKEKKTTMVIATHNMFQAETLTTRVALLLGGKIAQIGAPKEIFRGPPESLASFARLENVFSGTSRILQEGTSVINVENGVQIEAALRKSGKVTVFVRPEDIILSKKTVASSARNVFKGKIVEISDFGPVVKLKVDAGKEIIVQITKRSFIEMKLNVGSTVFLTFKASSVHLI
ncbi:MAG: Trehalose/maltose import ATP-binding protein MalK [Candidatus Bathyarchaeota archaeon BA2]|nr:MAG: Trehalose/maltose import ATP-binding protein MalK [Candidatus Bathyarchaeota archaeon BA2]